MTKLRFQTRNGNHGEVEGTPNSIAHVDAALRRSGMIERTEVLPDEAPPGIDPTPDVAPPADEPTPEPAGEPD